MFKHLIDLSIKHKVQHLFKQKHLHLASTQFLSTNVKLLSRKIMLHFIFKMAKNIKLHVKNKNAKILLAFYMV